MQAEYDVALFGAYSKYSTYFEKAYETYPVIPRGILEAICYTETDFSYHIPDEEAQYASYGLMGLILDGRGVFKDSLVVVSDLSGYTVHEIKKDPENHLMAFATAYVALRNQLQINSSNIEAQQPILEALSAHSNDVNKRRFPLDVYLYSVLSFLNDPNWQSMFGFPSYSVNMVSVFGEQNYKVLSSNYLSPDIGVQNFYGVTSLSAGPNCPSCVYPTGIKTDVQGATCFLDHSTPRGQADITHVVIHSTDAPHNFSRQLELWQQCGPTGTNFAAHYLVSKEGQIAKAFDEPLTVSHAGPVNPYTIGIEHVGQAAQNAWPPAVYQASGALVRGIACCYGINRASMYFGPGTGPQFPYPLPGCINIKGHGHYSPNPTGKWDPGAHWKWFDHYREVNNGAEPPFTSTETFTRCSGYLEDRGGVANDYPLNERSFITIRPEGAARVRLKFTKFNLAAGDWLGIWDGPDRNSPNRGVWILNTRPTGSGEATGTFVSSGNSVSLEFLSDCGNTADGWELTWEAVTDDGASPACCGVPTARQPINVTCNSATIRWHSVAGAVEYRVQSKRASDPFWPNPFSNTSVAGNVTSLELQNLDSNTNYDFRVLSVCAGSENSSLYSMPKQFKTCTRRTVNQGSGPTAEVCESDEGQVCSNCLLPLDLAANQITVSSAKLVWQHIEGVDGYNLQYKQASAPDWTGPIADDDGDLKINGLTSDSHYVFRVQTVCSTAGDSSNYSAETPFRTLQCTVPVNFRATRVDYRSVKMKWEDVPGALNYLVRFKPRSSSSWAELAPTTENARVLTGLLPNTEYEAQIKTACSEASGDISGFSDSARFTTSCRTPEDISVSPTSSSATIVWSATDAGLYHLRYRKTTASNPWTVIPDIGTTSYTINGLLGGDYEFQIRSTCSPSDSSGWSVRATFSLLCLDPSNLAGLAGETSVRLTWGGSAEVFNIRWRVHTAANNGAWTLNRVARSPHTITGLQKNTAYDFQVQSICALNSNGDDVLHSNWIPGGAGLLVSTMSDDESCNNPMVLHCPGQKYINVGRRSSGRLRISWGSPTRLGGWRVRIKRAVEEQYTNFDSWDSEIIRDCSPGQQPDHMDYFITVAGFGSATTYDLEVAIRCANGEFSNWITRRYTTAASSSVAPTAMAPTNVGSASATLHWQPAPGAASYNVRYGPSSNDDDSATTVNVAATSASLHISGLTTGSTYEYDVEAVFSNGTSGLSHSVAFVPSPPGSCAYAVGPTEPTTFLSEGGSNGLTVAAGTGCGWTGSSNANWITITSGASGSGNGTVSYTVSANAGPDSRTGTLIIAGLTRQITQTGADPINVIPSISEISPSSVMSGSGTFSLTVNGTNFMVGSFVSVDNIVRETEYISSSMTRVIVPTEDLMVPGSRMIVLYNPPPGRISNAVALNVAQNLNNPAPWVTAIHPRMATVGSSSFTLTVFGYGFMNGSVVRFNESDRPTTFLNPGMITAEIPSTDMANVGLPAITVFNPPPGGGLSNPATFYVNANPNRPVPSIATISPVNLAAGSGSFTLVINGSGFVGASQAWIGGTWRTTTYVTSTLITATIRSTDIESAGTREITVSNPAPGGGLSNSVTLTLDTPPNNPVGSNSPGRAGMLSGSVLQANLNGYAYEAASEEPREQWINRTSTRTGTSSVPDVPLLYVVALLLMCLRIRKQSS